MNLIRVDLPEPAFPFTQYGDLTISRRHRQSYSITTPSKRNSSTTSHFALSRCGQSCGITNPSKRNSSATKRCSSNCCTVQQNVVGSAVVAKLNSSHLNSSHLNSSHLNSSHLNSSYYNSS